MKKVKLVGLLALSGLAVSVLLTSCNKDSVNMKNLYGLDDDVIENYGKYEVIFKEGSEIPYISLADGVRFMSFVRKEALSQDEKYKVELNKSGNEYVITNEAGGKCAINPEKQTLTYDDYDKFTSIFYSSQRPLAMINVSPTAKAIKQISSDYTPGDKVVIDLKKYSKLDIYEHDNKAYLPLSVYNSVLLNPFNAVSIAYNGKDLFAITGDCLKETIGGIKYQTDFGKKLYEGAAKDTISDEYLQYYYQSLCFDFNIEYGLKDKFVDFDKFLTDYGYKNAILSNDPKKIDANTFLALTWLNDGHTAFNDCSFLYGFEDDELDPTVANPAVREHSEKDEQFVKARNQAGIKDGIEYKNDTAFISFKEFTNINETLFYLTMDTGYTAISLENTAILFNKLYTDLNSAQYKNTIKNIVVDLTANDGGAADALLYTLSTLLGEVKINSVDPLTGAVNKQSYKADINGDSKIDENDKSLQELGFNIYFLDSSYSFSSANAMPYVAKLNSSKVITLGAKTAGGPCAVRQNVTPIGSVLFSSSLQVISKFENGKYVNIDDGIAADYELTEAQMIDRDYIVANINNWR